MQPLRTKYSAGKEFFHEKKHFYYTEQYRFVESDSLDYYFKSF